MSRKYRKKVLEENWLKRNNHNGKAQPWILQEDIQACLIFQKEEYQAVTVKLISNKVHGSLHSMYSLLGFWF